jgi:hypothetical protein
MTFNTMLKWLLILYAVWMIGQLKPSPQWTSYCDPPCHRGE